MRCLKPNGESAVLGSRCWVLGAGSGFEVRTQNPEPRTGTRNRSPEPGTVCSLTPVHEPRARSRRAGPGDDQSESDGRRGGRVPRTARSWDRDITSRQADRTLRCVRSTKRGISRGARRSIARSSRAVTSAEQARASNVLRQPAFRAWLRPRSTPIRASVAAGSIFCVKKA